MVIRFESKKDFSFTIVLGVILLIYAIFGFAIAYTSGDYSALYIFALAGLGIGILFFALLKTTFYTVDEAFLICHIFGFKKKILLSEIRKIEPQNGFYAGLKINTAWKGLVVKYGKWDEILISPAKEQQFIETIKTKNPTLQA